MDASSLKYWMHIQNDAVFQFKKEKDNYSP